MGSKKTVSVAMGKLLVPKDAMGISRQMMDAKNLVGVGACQEIGFKSSIVKCCSVHLQTSQREITVGGRQ